MINISSPIQDSLLFSNKVYVDYEVTENSKFTDKVVIYIDDVKYEKTTLKDRFEAANLQEGKHTVRSYLVNKYNKKIVGSEKKFYFYTNDDVIETKKRVSNLLPTQIPEFIRNEYEQFVSFITRYYEFLESSNDPKLVPFSSFEFSDVDKTPEFFIDYFRKTFLPDLPKELTVDQETGKPLNIKTLIKRSSEFYRSKGTQNSFNFLFRILFDEDIEFYYPREHLFVVSGGKWTEKNTIKLLVRAGDESARTLVNNLIYQKNQSGTIVFSARPISCLLYKQSPYNVAELEIVESIGTIDAELPIQSDVIVEGAEEVLSYDLTRGISSITITASGYGYSIGDRVKLISVAGQVSEGVGFTGRVSKINSFGGILRVDVVNFGVNYEENLTGRYVVTAQSSSGFGFTGTASTSVLFNYVGYYSGSNGVLGEKSFIQDNNYYQTHSYEIISAVPVDSYYDIIKRTVHPAGYKLFGSQVVSPRLTLVPSSDSDKTNIDGIYSYYIGNYIAYRIDGDVNLRSTLLNSNPTEDLFPEGVNVEQPIPPDSDGYFIHDSLSNPETQDIELASFEVFESVFSFLPDVENINNYWVVFPHPSVLINNTNQTIENFYDLQIQDLAIVGTVSATGVEI